MDDNGPNDSNVKVAVRVRPMNRRGECRSGKSCESHWNFYLAGSFSHSLVPFLEVRFFFFKSTLFDYTGEQCSSLRVCKAGVNL